jgi:TonB family protein
MEGHCMTLQGWINRSRLLGLGCVGVLILGNAAMSSEPAADDTVYMETKQPHDARYITAIARLTTCKIPRETDVHLMVPLYPPESRKHHEEGKVIMQFLMDSDSCVRKATIVQSSGYYRLDKASLDFAMNLKLAPAALRNITTFDDGRPTFPFPITWKLTPAVPYDPTDRCTGGAVCVDEAPPPEKVEVKGASPEPGYLWMPGYYVHYAKTGYQWTEGQWGAPRPGYHWRAPHWERFRSKWLFTAGGWEADR